MMHKFKWVLVALACVVAFGTSDTVGQTIELDDQSTDRVGVAVTFTVSVDYPSSRSTVIEAVQFDIAFDPSVLENDTFTEGALTQSWALFDVSTPEQGKLRIAGLTTDSMTCIQAGTHQELVRLDFTVVRGANTRLTIENATDALADFMTRDGQFTSVVPPKNGGGGDGSGSGGGGGCTLNPGAQFDPTLFSVLALFMGVHVVRRLTRRQPLR